jgi:hypothetical protein
MLVEPQCFWVCGKAARHGGECVAEQSLFISWLGCGKGRMRRGPVTTNPSRGTPPITSDLSAGPTS